VDDVSPPRRDRRTWRAAADDNGHGTHTASTEAGNFHVKATALGAKQGTISGIAPRAQVIAYRVLGSEGTGFTSDIVAAIQQAVLDGVDVISYSISGSADPYGEPEDLAFRDAYASNVFVAAGAGNGGPTANTSVHNGGWEASRSSSSNRRG